MSEWFRTLASYLAGAIVLLGLLALSWELWNRRQLRHFRLTDAQIKAVQDSQGNRRPWWSEPTDHEEGK